MKNIAIIIALLVTAFLLYPFTLKADQLPTTVPDTEPLPVPAAVENAKPSDTDSLPQAPSGESSLISKSAEGAEVFIIEPGDGSVVSSPVTVKFGATNMAIVKAGDNQEHSGHHHLLIDLEELPPLDAPLPATEQLIHFGGGQTETTIELPPGEHTLQLLLGNYLHIPHDKPVLSKKITITVE